VMVSVLRRDVVASAAFVCVVGRAESIQGYLKQRALGRLALHFTPKRMTEEIARCPVQSASIYQSRP
jgi:hypothetical protein